MDSGWPEIKIDRNRGGGPRRSHPDTWPVFAGIGYGCVLLFLGYFEIGMGHGGFTIVSGISFSPFPPLPPVFWGAVGFFLAYRHRRWARRSLVVLLVGHYAGIWPTLKLLDDGVWARAPEPALTAIWFPIYVAGQFGVWSLLANATEAVSDSREKRFQFSIRRMLIAMLFFATAAGLMRTGDPMIQILAALPIGAGITVLADPLL